MWIPAFAGMTVAGKAGMTTRLAGILRRWRPPIVGAPGRAPHPATRILRHIYQTRPAANEKPPFRKRGVGGIHPYAARQSGAVDSRFRGNDGGGAGGNDGGGGGNDGGGGGNGDKVAGYSMALADVGVRAHGRAPLRGITNPISCP